jgi:hypothetical protein
MGMKFDEYGRLSRAGFIMQGLYRCYLLSESEGCPHWVLCRVRFLSFLDSSTSQNIEGYTDKNKMRGTLNGDDEWGAFPSMSLSIPTPLLSMFCLI